MVVVRTDAKPYINLFIASECICTLCIAGYLILKVRISMKGAILLILFIAQGLKASK